jgi:ribonuclease III
MENEKKNPYNFNNKLITKDFIESVLKKYEIYNINNLEIYQQAFTHKSYSATKNKMEEIVDKPEGALELRENDLERIEFLGDSVLGFVIAKYLFERFPNQNEGFLTKLKTKLVNGEALAYFSKELGFGEYILMSRHIEDKCNGRTSTNILEDVFEAFLGALFLDFNTIEIGGCDLYNDFYSGIGFQICERFIINLIEEKVNFEELINNDTNYKDQLSKFYHSEYKISVTYKHIACETEGNHNNFVVDVVRGDGEVIARGEGKTKKKAEQNASRNALANLNLI